MRVMHILLTSLLLIFVSGSAVAKDLLPSWNDGPAAAKGWIIVDMKKDLKAVFPAR
jgi:hypothetical protein